MISILFWYDIFQLKYMLKISFFFFFNRYAKVDIVASAPIVPFRETVVVPPKMDMANEVVETHNQVILV